MKNKKGFTLIELLASITIIALLTALIIPMSLNLIDKSNKEHCQRVVDTLLKGAELCYLDKLDGCVPNKNETSINISLDKLYINGYIEEEYKSESTDITIDKNNKFNEYTIQINMEDGYPKYTFNNTNTFCGN